MRKQRTAGKVRQVIERGGVQVGALRGHGCTNRARSERKISVSKFIYTLVHGLPPRTFMCRGVAQERIKRRYSTRPFLNLHLHFFRLLTESLL